MDKELITQWMDGLSFAEILEENNLTEEDVIFLLWRAGHIELPIWLEVRLEEEGDEL